ncbi:MAG: hypothetical protein WBP45_10880 [Daejeonella sp.]
MTKRNFWISTSLIIFLSLAGTGLWLYEILGLKGWYSLNWLEGQLYSPYAATLMAVIAFIIPFIISKQVSAKKIILPVIILYGISILCFEAGKQLCYALYCRFCFWTMKEYILIFSAAFILFVSIGISFWLVTDKLIRRNKKINMLFISMLTLAAVPLSLLTIQLSPGFGSQTDWVDTVKMGYPIFWITLLLGFSGIIIARQKINPFY